MPGSNNRVQFANGYRLEASAAEEWQIMQATATDVSCVNNAGNPEGVVPANMGSLCHDRTNGDLYVKNTGTGTTGWLLISTGGSTTDLHTARYIVSAGGAADGANYTTIASALTDAIAAGGNQTIFIQPGTYTEDLSWPVNINLAAFCCDQETPNVTIIGKLSCSDAGSRTATGIRFQTNSDNILAITGTVATVVKYVNCYFNLTNNTGFSNTSTSASSSIIIQFCRGDLTTTGIAYFAVTKGAFTVRNSIMGNTGGSTTASTASNDSSLTITNCLFSNVITTSNTASFVAICTDFFGAGIATFTINGTGTNEFSLCRLESGTSSAVSVGAGAICEVQNCVIDSSNTNVITGAGTVEIGGITYAGTSSNINITTLTVENEGPSRTIGSANSGGTNTLTVTNSSNTASSNAAIVATVGGTSAADAYYQAVVAGTMTWSWGIDNSDSDAWVLSSNASLGTTNVMRVSTAGEINYPLQPSFLAYLNNTVANVTGNSTEYTIIFDTEVFDQNGDFNLGTSTFTAPVTGRYFLQFSSLITGGTTITGANARIVTSNRTYNNTMPLSPGTTTACSMNLSVVADMDAADTCTFTVTTVDSGGLIDDITGTTSGNLRTFVSGNLVA